VRNLIINERNYIYLISILSDTNYFVITLFNLNYLKVQVSQRFNLFNSIDSLLRIVFRK